MTDKSGHEPGSGKASSAPAESALAKPDDSREATGSLAPISDAAATDLAFREGEAMRVEDVMRVLHLSKNTVYKLARTGELPSFRVGRQLRFRYDDVLRRLDSGNPAAGRSTWGGLAGAGGLSGGYRADAVGGAASDRLMADSAAASPAGNPAGDRQSGMNRVGPTVPDGEDILDELPKWARGSIIIGGQDIAGDILANYLSSLGVKTLRTHANSYVSLSRMYVGTCHAALLNLWSEAEQAYNKPYVRAFLPGVSAIVFRLYKHRVGFTVAARNPRGIRSWVDLVRGGATLVNRPRGDGSRVLLDEKLKYLEATSSQVNGYDREVASELAQGLIVARGLADVAVTGEKPFRQIKGLDFLPMQQEVVELAVVKTPRTAPMIKALRSLLRTNAFRSEFDPTLDDVSLMGEVVYES